MQTTSVQKTKLSHSSENGPRNNEFKQIGDIDRLSLSLAVSHLFRKELYGDNYLKKEFVGNAVFECTDLIQCTIVSDANLLFESILNMEVVCQCVGKDLMKVYELGYYHLCSDERATTENISFHNGLDFLSAFTGKSTTVTELLLDFSTESRNLRAIDGYTDHLECCRAFVETLIEG